jgi:hypothetical protein
MGHRVGELEFSAGAEEIAASKPILIAIRWKLIDGGSGVLLHNYIAIITLISLDHYRWLCRH